jgi:hypothetical protein
LNSDYLLYKIDNQLFTYKPATCFKNKGFTAAKSIFFKRKKIIFRLKISPPLSLHFDHPLLLK